MAAVTKRIAEETAALERLKEKLDDCKGARERAEHLVTERTQSYVRVFDAILAEQQVLNELYAPLMQRLKASGGSLAKLSFTVRRVADVEAWASWGEKNLFDLRTGPFRGIGSLAREANRMLLPAWTTGDSAAVAQAMSEFREVYQDALLEKAPYARTDQANYRPWTRRFAQWLYSTSHISIEYGISYDGTDIRKLSPGTRGIVLVLLYLALDNDDDRPLVIDQPEENLDPKSVYDELVPLFQAAKRRRQVIMVTHNANLVINADADQIIVAEVGTGRARQSFQLLSAIRISEQFRRLSFWRKTRCSNPRKWSMSRDFLSDVLRLIKRHQIGSRTVTRNDPIDPCASDVWRQAALQAGQVGQFGRYPKSRPIGARATNTVMTSRIENAVK